MKTFGDLDDGDIIYKHVYPENYIIPIKVNKVRHLFKSHLEVDVLGDDPDYPNNKKGTMTFNREDTSYLGYFASIEGLKYDIKKTIKELQELEKSI